VHGPPRTPSPPIAASGGPSRGGRSAEERGGGRGREIAKSKSGMDRRGGGRRFEGHARERSARGRSARAASGSAHVAPTWERRSLPYHSEIDARNNTFRIQHPSSPARRPRRSPRRAAPLRAAPRGACKVLIAAVGHAVAVDDGVLGVGAAAQPRDLNLARHGFVLRGAAMFAAPSSS